MNIRYLISKDVRRNSKMIEYKQYHPVLRGILEFVVRETKITLVSHITRKYATLSTQQEFK